MRTATVPAILGGIGLLAVGAAAVAQSADTTTVAPDAAYPGVIPGTGHPPPAASRAAREPRAVLTWPGFQLTEGGSRIFVQSTRPIEWSRADQNGRVVVVIRNARIHLTNSRRPLVTEHFAATPVARAKLERHGRDVHLVIELKVATIAGISTHDAGDGYWYLYVDFPAGQYGTPESNLPVAVEAPASGAVDLGGGLAIRRGRSRAATEEAAPVETPAAGATEVPPGATTTTTVTTTTTRTVTASGTTGGAAGATEGPVSAPAATPSPAPAPSPTPSQ